MSTTIPHVAPSPPPVTLTPSRIVGGVGGLVFAVVVIGQNLLRAASLPANDATADRVIEFYSQHRATTSLLVALFAISAVGLAAFVGSVVDHVRSSRARGALYAGVLGVTGIIALFTTTVAVDLTLSTYIHRGSPSPDVVSALWTLHNAVFALLAGSIGIALAGLSAAAAVEGLIGARWKTAGLIGGVALVASAAAAPAIVDGSPIMAVGLVGFVLWLAFVARTALALLTTRGGAAA